jgi:hypothetical protein
MGGVLERHGIVKRLQCVTALGTRMHEYVPLTN